MLDEGFGMLKVQLSFYIVLLLLSRATQDLSVKLPVGRFGFVKFIQTPREVT